MPVDFERTFESRKLRERASLVPPLPRLTPEFEPEGDEERYEVLVVGVRCDLDDSQAEGISLTDGRRRDPQGSCSPCSWLAMDLATNRCYVSMQKMEPLERVTQTGYTRGRSKCLNRSVLRMKSSMRYVT